MTDLFNRFPDGRIPLEFSWTSYRSQRLRAAQRAKMDAVFLGRAFEVVEKIDWTGTGRSFHTPIGHRGIRGYRLVEVADPSNEVFLGERTLAAAKQSYEIVDDISDT